MQSTWLLWISEAVCTHHFEQVPKQFGQTTTHTVRMMCEIQHEKTDEQHMMSSFVVQALATQQQ
jgi:hypothetical protein